MRLWRVLPLARSLLASTLLSGCAANNTVATLDQALQQATQQGYASEEIAAGNFRLRAWLRPPTPVSTLNIYIEGDGAAWPSPYHPPFDPTPRRPVALSLALADPASTASIIYLGRPCQYLDTAALAHCPLAYWTERRYAAEVIAAFDTALDQLKSRHGAQNLRLIGYSGGGVVATLLAARRTDVHSLTTVAAPLALTTWLKLHEASPLIGSLDPGEIPPRTTPHTLAHAIHFVGSRDETVPAIVVETFVRQHGGHIKHIVDFDHDCCWARDWPHLSTAAHMITR
jgi:hypothetical protein